VTELDAVALSRSHGSAVEFNRHAGMMRILGGTFLMGSDRHYAGEAPVHRVTVDAFWIDIVPVTNRKFSKFIHAIGLDPTRPFGTPLQVSGWIRRRASVSCTENTQPSHWLSLGPYFFQTV
jgi:formylglycine-generating enzyme required for sulfatase activity